MAVLAACAGLTRGAQDVRFARAGVEGSISPEGEELLELLCVLSQYFPLRVVVFSWELEWEVRIEHFQVYYSSIHLVMMQTEQHFGVLFCKNCGNFAASYDSCL